MKRKHSHNSPGNGCQIISKFFKISEAQEVKDVRRKEKDSVPISKPNISLAGTVLQKLTKLRESLSRRAINAELLGLYRNEKKEIMEEYDKVTSKNKPQSAENDSNAQKTEFDAEELNEYDKIYPSCVVQDNTAISISSDSLKSISKSLELYQSPTDVETEENCLPTDKNILDFQDKSNKDNVVTDFINISDTGNVIDNKVGQTDSSDNEEICQAATPAKFRSMTETRPSKMDQRLSSCAKVTDCDITYDSQFSDTLNSERNDEASDSDDDLLSPPSFLYEKTKFEVHTPDKIIAPFGASPSSSPVKPIIRVKEELNYRFTVNKLLKEKNRKESKSANLIKIEADLDAGIKKGGIKGMKDLMSEDETDSEVDDGKDLSKCKLPREVSKHLVNVSNFSEELSGEDIFPQLDNKILKCDMPILNIPYPPKDEDTFLSTLMSSKTDDVKELINGGWVMQYYLKRPCDASVAKWIFQIMCYYPDPFVSSQCFKILWALLKAGTEGQGGVPKGIRGMIWVPNIKSIILVLQHYGASQETIIPKELKSIFPLLNNVVNKEEKYEISKLDGSSCSSQLVFVMGRLIQFMTHCLHMAPLNFTLNDLHLVLVMSCRLSLDLRLQEYLFDLELLIFEVLNCFSESQWEEERKELPLLLVHLSNNHRNLLHILHMLPPSERGSQLRTLTCAILIPFLTKEFNSENGFSDSRKRTELLQSISSKATSEVSNLLLLVDEIQAKQTSSYYLLHTIISLFDLAIGNEDHRSFEQAELKKLAIKLSSLNGDIKDPRAAYLDRTKVKDLLVRTVNKIHFLVQAIEPPKKRELTEYFETNSSDYEVHTLGETLLDNSQQEEENVSSIESGSISSPGGSNKSCNGSDQENLVE